jgi:tetratricopeptide (TPR) repeat protein
VRDISDITEVFKIQSDIAKSIAENIGVNINKKEGEHIDIIPTNSPLAYDYYLKGKEMIFANMFGQDNIKAAIELFEQAVALDSSFVLAWVGLAESNRWLYWVHISYYRGDKDEHFRRVQEQIHKTKNYLDKAINLAPDLKEVRLEEGVYYYQCERNDTKALQILDRLRIDYPNDAETLFWISLVLRRKGEFEKSFEYIEKAISLNPSNYQYWHEAGGTLVILRKYEESEKYYKKASALHPNTNWYSGFYFRFYLITGEYKKAIQYLDKHADALPEIAVNLAKSTVYFFKGDFMQTINLLESIPYDSVDMSVNLPIYELLASAYDYALNEKMANEYYNKAKEIIELNIPDEEKDAVTYSSYAISLAGVGMKEQAFDAIDKALEIQSYSGEDALDGDNIHITKAQVLVRVGEYDEAIKELKYILNHYGGLLTIQNLKDFPIWKPLREMEEFQAIINNPEYQPR